MNSLKKHWTYADSAFLASGAIYLLFLYLRLHYAGLYMGHFGELKWDWLILGYYMAEAALIGSFADWFAVTAVFKVPWICRLLRLWPSIRRFCRVAERVLCVAVVKWYSRSF